MSYGSRHFGGNEVDWNRDQERHDQDAVDEAVLEHDEWDPDTLGSLSPDGWDDLTTKWESEYLKENGLVGPTALAEPSLGSGCEQSGDGGE